MNEWDYSGVQVRLQPAVDANARSATFPAKKYIKVEPRSHSVPAKENYMVFNSLEEFVFCRQQ